MVIFLEILVMTAALFLLQEIFRRYEKVTLLFFTVLPAALSFLWINKGINDWFRWAKILSVIAGVLFFTACKYTKLGEKKWSKFVVFVILAVNILEACIKDFQGDSWVHYLNAAAGLLLIVTLNRLDTIFVHKSENVKDLYWGSMTFMWIIGYTIWNWVFTYLNFVEHSGNHLAVLGSALIIGILQKERWLQARAFTLGTYIIYIYTFDKFADNFNTFNWYNIWMERAVSSLSLTFMVGYFVWFVYGLVKKRAVHVGEKAVQVH